MEGRDGDFKELFHEEAAKTKKPWWKTHFFVRDPVLFGTWDGVFTSCLINIFGVVLFLRTGWMVGNVGLGLAILIVFMTVSVALLASLAAIGVCERLRDVHSGGVYFVVSHVLGGRIGGTVGVMYAFGLCIVSALYCTGFAESITATFGWTNDWAVRGVAILTLFLLLGINLAGVKWVIRLQLLLLLVLVVSTSDFIIGTMVHTDPVAGFVGFSSEVLSNNTYPSYSPGEDFFSVFGVFFPTATGVMAGVNMSGDLRKPAQSIPNGTLSALLLSLVLYLIFVFLLASTCLRWALQNDFMIAEKVSAVSFLWLAGLYMSSTSSCSTGLYGAPRVLQSIANQNVVPIIRVLGKGFGANKTPILAICVVGFVALLFIFIGNLNAISPMITCNFMLVYAVIDYAYFALAMTYDLRTKNLEKYTVKYIARDQDKVHVNKTSYGSFNNEAPVGTMLEFSQDLDKMFQNYEPRSMHTETPQHDEKLYPMEQVSGLEHLRETFKLGSQMDLDEHQESDSKVNQEEMVRQENERDRTGQQVREVENKEGNKEHQTEEDQEEINVSEQNHFSIPSTRVEGYASEADISIPVDPSFANDTVELVDRSKPKSPEHQDAGVLNYGYEYQEILKQPKSWYSRLCNRWLSLFGVLLSLVVMFLINWMYSLMNILAFALVYIYISQASPGLNPGVTNEFNVEIWIRDSFRSCCRSEPPPQEQIILTPMAITPVMTVPEQLTSDNEDFASRRRYHQAQTENHDYDSILPIMSTVQ